MTNYTTKRGVFSFQGATNSAWQVLSDNQPVRVKLRGREISLIFKHEDAAKSALLALSDGKDKAAALSIGRKVDDAAFKLADMVSAQKYLVK